MEATPCNLEDKCPLVIRRIRLTSQGIEIPGVTLGATKVQMPDSTTWSRTVYHLLILRRAAVCDPPL